MKTDTVAKMYFSGIKSNIEALLKRRATADGLNISVKVLGGEVTLTGTVHTWSEGELAKHAAWSTPGVRNVVDSMTIV